MNFFSNNRLKGDTMITFIAFLLTLAGCINWLLIGLLQYDFIAGLFGYQGSIFSRLVYILFGIGAAYLVLRVIINKGTFKVFERKKKKQKFSESQQAPTNAQPAMANVEASTEQLPQKKPKKKKWWQFLKKQKKEKKQNHQTEHESSQQVVNTQLNNPSLETNRNDTSNFFDSNPQSEALQAQDNLFDEHFKS